MIDTQILTVEDEYASQRIDKYLSEKMENISRSAAQKLIDDGNVRVNFIIVTKNYKVKAGDRVVVTVPEPKTLEAKPENIPLDVRYEDSDLLVVNKPKGMVVHPAAGNFDGTL
ncbi:MAG: RNA pseudouridine synthase, partial [Clostridia bacterium]|nr:RNA pseudouridine synthase [Clostridia bacterium]